MGKHTRYHFFYFRHFRIQPARFQLLGAVFAIAAGILSGAGCAKIAEPQPPEVHIPKPSVDLAVRQLSDFFVLTVSKPAQNTDGSPATTLRSVEVFRLAENANTGGSGQPLPEEQFMKQATRIQSIPSAHFPSYLNGNVFVIQDKLLLPQGPAIYSHTFRYAVLFTNNKNQAAGLSNQARIRPAPIPLPPEALSAEVMEDSIRLKWTVPLENMDGSKPARIAGYNVYRSEESEKLPAAPMNPDPLQRPEFEDRNFQFDKTYYFAVSTVGSLQNPYAESLPSRIYPVTVRDTFPPAPPRDFSAIIEDGSAILLWVPSSSADIAGYRIYRQEKGAATKQLLQNEPITALSFRDTRVEPDKSYEYTIQAVDTHGNESTTVRTEAEKR